MNLLGRNERFIRRSPRQQRFFFFFAIKKGTKIFESWIPRRERVNHWMNLWICEHVCCVGNLILGSSTAFLHACRWNLHKNISAFYSVPGKNHSDSEGSLGLATSWIMHGQDNRKSRRGWNLVSLKFREVPNPKVLASKRLIWSELPRSRHLPSPKEIEHWHFDGRVTSAQSNHHRAT